MEIIGYINEQKLVIYIQEIINNINFLEKSESKFLGTQIRFDDNKRLAFDCGFILNNKKYLVEFDGYRHYTDAIAMYRDNKKDIIAKNNGFILVRFPYWIQLTNQTFELLFNQQIKFKISTAYPHGFISNKAVLPCNYCFYGYKRFLEELRMLPRKLQDDIFCSLIYQSNIRKIPMEYIFQDYKYFEIKLDNYVNEINYIYNYPYKELY